MIKKNKELIDGAEKEKIQMWEGGRYRASGIKAAIAAKYMGIAPLNELSYDSQVMRDRTPTSPVLYMNDKALEDEPSAVRDAMAPAQFAAGWYYGITYEDKSDELLKCYA